MNPKTRVRLCAHFTACSAVATLGATQEADAAIVYSGVVNIAIPNTVDGLYINLVTMQQGSSGATVPGWDFNPYFTGGNSNFYSAGGTMGVVAATPTSPASNLPFGYFIGPSTTFNTGISQGSNFSNTVVGCVGFKFFNEVTGQTNYGWAFVTMPDATHPGRLQEFFFDNAGNSVVVSFPGPGGLAVLALGAAGLSRRQRRSGLSFT